MKKLISVILILSTIICLSACSDNYNPAVTTSTTVPETEPTTAAPLSASFEYELASGYDADDNFYQLVANETESYSGLTVTIAVIKNNELLIEPTSESPFNDETGLLANKTAEELSTATYGRINYVGNGCFYLDEIIWNVNTNQSFDGGDEWELETVFYYNDDEEIICNNDGMFLYHSTDDWNYGTFLLLDTNTMDTQNIVYEDIQRDPITLSVLMEFGAYTDGLLYIGCPPHLANNGMSASYEGFYEIEGNQVISLEEYDFWHPWQGLGFKNGKAVFKIENNAGTPYMITMGKTGAVIESVEIIEEEEEDE